ncbi:MAG: valine--tRNA ligase, partial [Schleiferiaceae bacterium]|nr:valine--tRNA ligase [Schleiferiaceae bacterium]
MEIPSKYNPGEAESKWYQYWLDNNCFRSVPDDREPFVITIPPPNVTGVLHMGHMLNNTIQDVLVRRARLLGKNACWVPGTDHASIATEAKVVAKLKEQGINKADLTRDEFLKHAWEWTDKHGGIILEQLKKLGASCDWERTAFTLDEARYESVIQTFVDLYNKGLVYRGYRMVNWDPEAQTTVSDEEVNHKEVNGKLYYMRYYTEDKTSYLTVATTRPETIFGDVAVCVNPNDERYKNLIGTKVVVPIVNRSVAIISDAYVDPEFGTGCLKITPAHDTNDKEIGDRHQLEIIDALNSDGTMNAHALHFAGLDRFAARKAVAKELDEKGLLEKVEEYKTSVGTSERTGAVIEPRLSEQWFLKMKDLSQPALDAVLNEEVKLIPEKFINTYRHWMENVRDWCISRQLWWGHQIPAWYFGTGREDYVVAKDADEALQLARDKSGNAKLVAADLKQDPDALDTWFSSWLWPISVFDGIRQPDNDEINYYYPTDVLVTAPEILFFWVARMIMAGYEYRGKRPFEFVYLTGIVRDKQGRKMSKSLGNSPDPIALINQFGADGVRVGMLLTSPAGNDLPFDEDLCLQGRNFSNKIWNAFRLVKGWEVVSADQPESSKAAIDWFESRFSEALASINDSMDKFRLSEALMTAYKLVWDDFCAWYLEMIKPAYGSPMDSATYSATTAILEKLLVVLHPFTPFLTEEIWQYLEPRKDGETIMYTQWPTIATVDETTLLQFNLVAELVTEVRNFRNEKGLSPKESIQLYAKSNLELSAGFKAALMKMANISEIHAPAAPEGQAFGFVIGKLEFAIPMEGNIDIAAEIEKLQEELRYTEGFLNMVNKKLSNEKFVSGAPEKVVA